MNVAVTTAAEGFSRRAFTVEDISRMIEAGVIGEEEKFELVEGEIVMMAAKSLAHERIKSALTAAVARALPDHLAIGVEATLRLTDTTMLEPDIAVFPKALFDRPTKFTHLDPGEADLVIEVAVSSACSGKVDTGFPTRTCANAKSAERGPIQRIGSRSSLAYDKGLKARLYARHRVKEFWVIDANARTTWVHTGPTGEGWSSVVERGPQEMLTTQALPGFSIRLSDV